VLGGLRGEGEQRGNRKKKDPKVANSRHLVLWGRKRGSKVSKEKPTTGEVHRGNKGEGEG